MTNNKRMKLINNRRTNEQIFNSLVHYTSSLSEKYPHSIVHSLPSSAYKQPGSNQQPIGWAEFPD